MCNLFIRAFFCGKEGSMNIVKCIWKWWSPTIPSEVQCSIYCPLSHSLYFEISRCCSCCCNRSQIIKDLSNSWTPLDIHWGRYQGENCHLSAQKVQLRLCTYYCLWTSLWTLQRKIMAHCTLILDKKDQVLMEEFQESWKVKGKIKNKQLSFVKHQGKRIIVENEAKSKK